MPPVLDPDSGAFESQPHGSVPPPSPAVASPGVAPFAAAGARVSPPPSPSFAALLAGGARASPPPSPSFAALLAAGGARASPPPSPSVAGAHAGAGDGASPPPSPSGAACSAPCPREVIEVAVPRPLGEPPSLLTLEPNAGPSLYPQEEVADQPADSPPLTAVVHTGDWRLGIGGRGCSPRSDALCEELRAAGQHPRGRLEALHALLLARASAHPGEVQQLLPTEVPVVRPGETHQAKCGWCGREAQCLEGTWKGDVVCYTESCWLSTAAWVLEDSEFVYGLLPGKAPGVAPERLTALQPAGFLALSVFREDRRPRGRGNGALLYMVPPDPLELRLSLTEFLGLLVAIGEGISRLLAHANAAQPEASRIGRCRVCLPDVDSLHPEALKVEATAALVLGLMGQPSGGARHELVCGGKGAFERAWDHISEAAADAGVMSLPVSPSASGIPLHHVRFLHRTSPCAWERAAARLAAAEGSLASAAEFVDLVSEVRGLGGIVQAGGELLGLLAAASALGEGAGPVARFVTACARRLPELFPQGLRLLRRGEPAPQLLSRRQCAALVAGTIFGLVPRQDLGQRDEWVNLPSFDVSGLLGREDSAQQAMCVLHFFRELSKADSGFLDCEYVSFSRRAAPPELAVNERGFWAGAPAEGKPLGSLEIASGRIEEAHGTLQADFANRFLGGGALAGALAQEEIRFLASPECMAGCLFVEKMQPNEAIFIAGALQFSTYRGYWEDFAFAGPAPEAGLRGRPLDQRGCREVHIVAFDAVSWSRRPREEQYREDFVRRELIKAYAACLGDASDEGSQRRPLATGNWGCGAFKGDPQLKSLIQWLAASMAGRSILYYPYGDSRVARLAEVVSRVQQSGADCARLYAALCGCPPDRSVFETVLERLGA